MRMLGRALADAQPLSPIRDGDTLGAETFGLLHDGNRDTEAN